MINLKKYDKKLSLRRKLDGSIEIIRNSQFSKQKEYVVLTIQNKFLGSGNFILTKLQSIDTRRIDIIKDILDKNLLLTNKKTDNRMHSDMADFIRQGKKIII